MRFILLLLVFCFIPGLAFARGGEGGMERFRITGFYGYGSVLAGDVNNYINQQSGTPRWGNLTNSWQYGAELGMMLTPRWELVGKYDQEWATNPVNTTSPTVTNAGAQLYMNAAWAGLNFWLLDHGSLHLAVGALGGYPTYAHATIVSSAGYSQYDSAASPMGQFMGTAEINMGRILAIHLEGGYQYALLGPLADGSTAASNLKQSGNSNVNMDMSGWKAEAGLTVHF